MLKCSTINYDIYRSPIVYIKMKLNNNSKKLSQKQRKLEIDLKNHSIEELYAKAETEYYKESQKEQNKWHSIISRGGTKKDKIGLMAS